jgi:hypothetical protein
VVDDRHTASAEGVGDSRAYLGQGRADILDGDAHDILDALKEHTERRHGVLDRIGRQLGRHHGGISEQSVLTP